MTDHAIKLCYHCGKTAKKAALLHCERWSVSVCAQCVKVHHKPSHASCRKDHDAKAKLDLASKKEKPRRRTFSISLTSEKGSVINVVVPVGTPITVERHPETGSYIYHSVGLYWVRESREEINKAILRGLRSID